MNNRIVRRVALVLALWTVPVLAQQSSSFRLTESVFNNAGRPEAGVTPASAGFRISLDSVGESVTLSSANSGSFEMDAGLIPGLRPPGEIEQLRFADGQTVEWVPERSSGSYNLYRGRLSLLTGLGFGDCNVQGLAEPIAVDAELPPAGDGYFYLATVVNRLREEGTKGSSTSGAEREGAVCP